MRHQDIDLGTLMRRFAGVFIGLGALMLLPACETPPESGGGSPELVTRDRHGGNLHILLGYGPDNPGGGGGEGPGDGTTCDAPPDGCDYHCDNGFTVEEPFCHNDPPPGGGGGGGGGGGCSALASPPADPDGAPLLAAGGCGGGGGGVNPNKLPPPDGKALDKFAAAIGHPAPAGWHFNFVPSENFFGWTHADTKTIDVSLGAYADGVERVKATIVHELVHVEQVETGNSADRRVPGAIEMNELEAYDTEIAYVDSHGYRDAPIDPRDGPRTLGAYVDAQGDKHFGWLRTGGDESSRFYLRQYVESRGYKLRRGDTEGPGGRAPDDRL
jgi:hypothetical protein